MNNPEIVSLSLFITFTLFVFYKLFFLCVIKCFNTPNTVATQLSVDLNSNPVYIESFPIENQNRSIVGN